MDLEGTPSSDVVPGLTAVAVICGAGGSCGTCSLVGVCSTATELVIGVASEGGIAMGCLVSAALAVTTKAEWFC